MVAFLTSEVRSGDLQQREGADREDDHRDGVHATHAAPGVTGPKPGERHVADRTDDGVAPHQTPPVRNEPAA
jgi:hypothetical protein